MNCNCSHKNDEKAHSENEFHSIAANQLTNLFGAVQESLSKVSPAAAALFKSASPAELMDAGQGIQTHVHIAPNGDTLVSSSLAEGNQGDIVLRGNIGPFPYEIHIKISLEDTTVVVTLQMIKPFEVGPYTWRFSLGGITRGGDGAIIGATTVIPIETASAIPFGLNWWCVLKCGGTSILPTLVLCLPSLTGGPAAYIACVVAKVGAGDAAQIAKCVAEKCV